MPRPRGNPRGKTHDLTFTTQKIWEILCQVDKLLTNREISEMIEKNTGLNLYFQVGNLLFTWYRRKVLDKIGGKRPYEYKIKADYKGKDRPVSSMRF